MQIFTTVAAMRTACQGLRSKSDATPGLGLIPTMGAFHEGHASLMRAARARNLAVVVSLFVNPLQFGPNEDFTRYPRSFDQDCEFLEHEGIDLLFAPSPEEMYPAGGANTFVEVPGVGDRLDGRSRPGHFRGVATVVCKLLHIIGPEEVYFGQKDAAQVAVLRAMVRDLNFPTRLIVCPTVRDADGLALSSRNRFLSPAERTQALALSQSLRVVSKAVSQGVFEVPLLTRLLLDEFEATDLRLDYAEIVDPNTLEPVMNLRQGALVAVAAYVGQTRLIDNLLLPSNDGQDDRQMQL